VAEYLHHDALVNALSKQQSGRGVPGIVGQPTEQAVELDRHQARLGMQLGQRSPDLSRVGHGVRRHPRNMMIAPVPSGNQPPGRESHRADPDRSLVRQSSGDHRSSLIHLTSSDGAHNAAWLGA